MTLIAMDFIDLQEKEGNGFNCEQLLILCVISCQGIWVLWVAYSALQPQIDSWHWVNNLHYKKNTLKIIYD